MTAARFKRLINWYPPYLGAGIRATHVDDDFRRIRVELRLRWYNRNYVGTHFGGSLFAMTDPFLMLMAIHNLGPDYVVWDKSATIDFLAPGRATVWAEFTLTEADIAAMREHTASGDKYLPRFDVDVIDEGGTVVARIHKELHVRRRRSAPAA